MKYIVCNNPGEFKLSEKEVPKRKKNEAMVKIKKVGICGTDIHAFLGNQAFFKYPRILGHELVAEVMEIDPNTEGVNKGDRVVVIPYLNCRTCIACKMGKTNCCSKIRVLGVHIDGGMQEQITVPMDNLLLVNHLSDNQSVIIEPLAIGAHAIRRSNLIRNEVVVVIGCGPIGIGIMKLAQIVGAKVIALDINENRLKYVKETIGVDTIINVRDNPVKLISDVTNGDMAQVVFDASGQKAALEAGPSYMAHGGRFVLVGLSKDQLSYSHPEIHSKEATILCSRNATKEDFQHVIGVLDQFPTESYITHEMMFREITFNFESLLKPENEVIKATYTFD